MKTTSLSFCVLMAVVVLALAAGCAPPLLPTSVAVPSHGDVQPLVDLANLLPALGLQTLSGEGFTLRYPAHAQVEIHEGYLRILGPEIAIRPADADWGWWGWAYEMVVDVLDNPGGLSAADWARQHILSEWKKAQAASGPFTGPVSDDGRIIEDAMAEVSVGGLAAVQADWFGGDSTRRVIYVTDIPDGKRVVRFIFNLHPIENNPIARVQEDVYALILSTFQFNERP
ncbi:MAG: hypothetical protein H8D78_13830 [Chloroflexi bacterium]|nr:hypothetical protein [Chloroflexota bacterium]